MKSKRHALILELINKCDIETQEEIQSKLSACGIHTTQATISRDINELRLVKTPLGQGRFKYTLQPIDQERQQRFYSIFQSSVIMIDYAANTVVVKCESGMAGAACAAFDGMDFTEIVGTIAGDDTFFVLLRTEIAAATLCKHLQKNFLDNT